LLNASVADSRGLAAISIALARIVCAKVAADFRASFTELRTLARAALAALAALRRPRRIDRETVQAAMPTMTAARATPGNQERRPLSVVGGDVVDVVEDAGYAGDVGDDETGVTL
jgi:hypothetical protein